jgi:HSP20 family protein
MLNMEKPPVDILEEDDKYIIIMDVPGMHPENIEITGDETSITIKGYRKPEFCGKYVRMERFVGKIYRKIQFPKFINLKKTTAQLKNGVLVINVPKALNELVLDSRIKIIIRR